MDKSDILINLGQNLSNNVFDFAGANYNENDSCWYLAVTCALANKYMFLFTLNDKNMLVLKNEFNDKNNNNNSKKCNIVVGQPTVETIWKVLNAAYDKTFACEKFEEDLMNK